MTYEELNSRLIMQLECPVCHKEQRTLLHLIIHLYDNEERSVGAIRELIKDLQIIYEPLS